MAETFSVKIENLAEIRSAFRKAPDLTVKYVNRAIEASLWRILQASDPYTPVDTGYLRSNNEMMFAPAKGTLIKAASYAGYVHNGTKYMQPRPFLLQGIADSEQTIQEYFKDAVQHVLDDIGHMV